MTISSRCALGFALATLAIGCVAGCGTGSADPADTQVVADGAQAMMATTQSTYLGSLVFEAVSVVDPVAAAAQLAGAAPPATCVHLGTTSDPKVSRVTLQGCTGPFGLELDGSETATFSTLADGVLHVSVSGDADLRADGAPVQFSADVTFSAADSTSRSVVWQGNWQRTDEGGELVTHVSDLEIAVDLVADCRTASGTAETEVASRSVETTLSGYKVCRDATGEEGCPSGSVVHTGTPSGRVVSIAFDDSAVAEVTGPRGETYAVALACTSIGR